MTGLLMHMYKDWSSAHTRCTLISAIPPESLPSIVCVWKWVLFNMTFAQASQITFCTCDNHVIISRSHKNKCITEKHHVTSKLLFFVTQIILCPSVSVLVPILDFKMVD